MYASYYFLFLAGFFATWKIHSIMAGYERAIGLVFSIWIGTINLGL